jgi:hypothetical protein
MIKLNFLPFNDQDFSINVYRRRLKGERNKESFYHTFIENDISEEFEIKFIEENEFEAYAVSGYQNTRVIAKAIYEKLLSNFPKEQIIIKHDDFNNKRIHFVLDTHPKGRKCVWLEPYYLKSRNAWGVLLDYHFLVNEEGEKKFKLDKEIQIASGSLNASGNSNVDYYLFKHSYIQRFIKQFIPAINNILVNKLDGNLFEIDSRQLASKIYLFGNNYSSSSSYLGLTKNPPLHQINEEVKFYFIYLKTQRDIAVALLKGLRGESHPTTFGGLEKLFKLPFTNDRIKGKAIDNFDDSTIDAEITVIKDLGNVVIPIIITNSKKDEDDDKLYFWLKHKFTKAGIPCQVVTRDLVQNDYSLKYSLSNIGLQIFAKAGGQPWKMKSATQEYLIVGIGQSYNIEEVDNGNKIEKNITYSVLTDSSGLFKDIQVLCEGVQDDNYYDHLVLNISKIINSSGYTKVSIHSPFRMSKEKILEKVARNISPDIELSVLVINSKSDFFGFDYQNNGLVPFESTYIKLAADEFLVWFEGLQYNNPKITKRFGNPLLIKFWYTNKPMLFQDYSYKEYLLQDCINLSGANWRGFKAKQLPVSVFYCQRIAEFIKKFKEYDLEHIEISNLKPWFL